tara:strand:+ start:2922 stop:3782 length:861 start_codon:yes stop_codon:yes gene_type:complete
MLFSQFCKNNILIILFVVLGLTFFLFQYLKRIYNNHCHSKSNRIKTDVTEVVPNINYKMNQPDKVIHLFWTGGYDSTFRLCQILLLEDKAVQPIYIMCGNTDSDSVLIQRKNQNKELQTMKKIRQKIIKDFPYLAIKFLPTHYVINLKKNSTISNTFKDLHYRFHFFPRPGNQYERMARFASDYPYPIEVGVEKCHIGLDEATQKHRTGKGHQCQLVQHLPHRYLGLEIFRSFRFPIVHLTKEEMKMNAIKNNFYYLLKMSWSCWYPSYDGKPCLKCPMCQENIIK